MCGGANEHEEAVEGYDGRKGATLGRREAWLRGKIEGDFHGLAEG